MTGVVSDGLDDGDPRLSKLSLSVVGVSHQQIRAVEDGVEHIVQGAPAHQLVDVHQERAYGLGGCMLDQMWQNIATFLKRSHGIVDLPLRHADHSGASEFHARFSHARPGHEGQNGHERLHHGLHGEQALSVGHDGDVSSTESLNQIR